jgi:hypothetical protein
MPEGRAGRVWIRCVAGGSEAGECRQAGIYAEALCAELWEVKRWRKMANEKRLIDANALKWKIGQVRLYVASLRFGKTIISKILESYRKAVFYEIEDAPTVDAVEVVRCKDCCHGRQIDKARSPEKYFKDTCVVCQCESVVGDEPMIYEPTHFCSYGKRKDDDTTTDKA